VLNLHLYKLTAAGGLFDLSLGAAVAQVSVPAAAAVYASGFNGPRGLAFGPDGALYVAEIGTGGTQSTGTTCTQVIGPMGPFTGGTTAQISKILNGAKTVVAGLLLAGTVAFAQNDQASPGAISLDPSSWRKAIVKLPVPQKGCYQATYPAAEWTPVPCRSGPAKNLPVPGTKLGPTTPAPLNITNKKVGNGVDDFAAEVPASNTGTIVWAQGSFDKVTTTGETNVSLNGIATRRSEYSLQLNTNTFPAAPLCSNAPNKACAGWQQLIFANDPGSPPSYTQSQYFLLNYNVVSGASCPPGGWTPSGLDCYIYSPESDVPTEDIASLSNIVLTLQANENGTDTMTFTSPAGSVFASNQDSVLSLAANWKDAEFNVFGDLSQHQALFDPGSSLVVRTQAKLKDGTTTPVPGLVNLTGETNSLTLVKPACTIGSPFFAITFMESNVAGASYACPAPPPPPNLCQEDQESVALDQKALAAAQAAVNTKSCQGQAMLLCAQKVKIAQQALTAAEAEEKKDCI
jgi:hypothetical protein